VIDFRYHVVSIVAIFLALTVGLVIGASILSKSVADNLKSSLTQRNNQIKSQQDQINTLKSQMDQQNKYITNTADALTSGRLGGLCITLVEIAGADANAYADTRTMIQKQAGATICGEIMVNAAFTASSSQPALTTLLQEHTPSGQTLTGSLAQQGAELVAEALTTYQDVGAVAQTANPTPTATASAKSTAKSTAKSPAKSHASGSPSPGAAGTPGAGGADATMTAGQALGTLDDFQTAGLITILTQPVSGEAPTLAYVQAPSSANADADNQTYITLAEALRKGGAGTVVGGSGQSAEKGGLVYAVINDSTATREISTVDDTDVTMGQVASVFSLSAESQGGQSTAAGHYGTGANNDGPVPPITAGLG
jgi:Copper transport outer membrane protein, MctB